MPDLVKNWRFVYAQEVKMYYNYYQTTPYEHDEFSSKGPDSACPSLCFLQEIILIYLKELAYYLLKLKEFGATNNIIKDNVIEAISGIIANVEYNHSQFEKLIMVLSKDLSQAKLLYSNICKKNNKECNFLKTHFKHGKVFDINDIIKKGELYFIKKNMMYTAEQKHLFDIMLFLVKNMCLRIIQIKSYNKNYEEAYNSILVMLNSMHIDDAPIEKTKSIIENGTQQYHTLIKQLSDAQEEAHGARESVYISFAPKTGKAILVSGIDLTQLEAILKATKDRGVDVYTHGMTMLMAHTLANFRTYPNLVGHFGKGSDNSLFDFAAFPGAILTTRYLFQRVEYLYRGRIFTTDDFAPKGFVKIQNNDFEPLIQAALVSKGFTKHQQEVIMKVGFRQKEIEESVHDIIGKMERNEIKHLYIIGLLKSENEYKEYFDEFLKLMPKDCYALSLSYDKKEENILHIDSFYDHLFIYKLLEEMGKKIPLSELKISIFITKCDQYTIVNVINFKNLGINSIYLCKCIPTLVNPALAYTVRKTFGINEFTTPAQDLEKTLAE